MFIRQHVIILTHFNYLLLKVKSFLFACEEGNLSIIEVFLAHEGFNVNAQNEVKNMSEFVFSSVWKSLCMDCFFVVVASFVILNSFSCVCLWTGWSHRIDVCGHKQAHRCSRDVTGASSDQHQRTRQCKCCVIKLVSSLFFWFRVSCQNKIERE